MQKRRVRTLPRRSAFTFVGTLQPLALGGVQGGDFLRLAGRPADADFVHGSDPEVVGVAHAEAVHRVFTHLHGGVVALDPSVGTDVTPERQRETLQETVSLQET